LNIKGEVIGINVATVMGAENIGFAIPINAARRDLEDIQRYGRIRKPFLGLRYLIVNKEIARKFDLPTLQGAYLIKEDIPGDEAVVKGSPGDKAGLKEKDLIIEFKGEPVMEARTLQDILEDCKIGERIKVKFLRKGKKFETDVVLEERP
jgi:serine protease Do